MSIAEKFEVISDRVYDKGVADKESEFWDNIQDNGTRKIYSYAFSRWNNSEYIHPKHKVIPNGDVNHMFFHCHNLKKVESKYFDFSNVPTTASFNAMFNSCYALEEIEDINLCVGKLYQTFSFDWELHTIARLTVSETVIYTDAFLQCNKLKNITFDGVIGQSINFQWSPLSVVSMKNIISHLKPTPTNTCTLTFNTDCWTNLEASGKPYQEEWTGVTDETITWQEYVFDTLGWDV